MKQKRIFIISTEFPPSPGGIGTHAAELAKQLHRMGWLVNVFTEQPNCTEEDVKNYNTSSPFSIFRLLPTPSMVLLLRKFISLFLAVLKHNPDIILGTGKHGAWFAIAVGKLTFKKTVAIGHGTEFTITMSPRSRKINNWIYSNADKIIYVSNYTRRISEQAGITNKNYEIIYNGANEELFSPIDATEVEAFKKAKGLTGKKIIVTLGKLQPRKGNEWVIRAMPEIVKQVPEAHYYNVGSPNIQPRLEEIARELNVSDHVHFPGKVPFADLPLWLNACDIFAMTSIATDDGDVEGFGIAIIEAALCAKPAVVTAESGPGEAIIEGVTGLGVKEKDYAAIAQKCIYLFKNDEARSAIGTNAYNNAINNLTWAMVVKKYDQTFSKMIGK